MCLMITRRLIPALHVSLVLVVFLTSQAFALARGQAAPVDTVVICQGHLAVTIYLDADGNPVEVPHLCPDAAILASDGPAVAAFGVAPDKGQVVYAPATLQGWSPKLRPEYASRAPPASVQSI